MLIPDRWLEGIPLGYRNRVDRSIPFPFLISESTIPEDLIRDNIITYEEYKKLKKDKTPFKTWNPELQLVNWFNVPSHIVVNKLNSEELQDYILNLLARWIFGISDLADRNFLRRNGRVYSIDEEYKNRPVSFKTELRKNKCEYLHKWIVRNYETSLYPAIINWGVPEPYLEKLTFLMNKDNVLGLFM
jgi:hypothetical protein